MNKFLKSTGGKTTAFVVCVLSVCIFVASIATAVFMAETDYYSKDKDAVYEYLVQYSGEGAYDSIWNEHSIHEFVNKTYPLKHSVYAIAGFALILIIASFVALMSVAGRRNEDEELHPGPLNRIPFDIMLCIVACLFELFVLFCTENYWPDFFFIAGIILGGIVFINLLLGLCMSLAVRIKQKNTIKGSFIFFIFKCIVKLSKLIWRIITKLLKSIWNGARRFLRAVRGGISRIPLIWKTVVVILVVCLYEVISLNEYNTGILWFLEKLFLIPAVMYIALSLKSLQRGGEALADGDMEYRVHTDKLIWGFKRHGENLNSISKGMAIAVENQMKSERMKTELITNVSHDIKTPLTSIINYSNLICEEQTDNKKISEYSEVLLRQSERLKRLIEDLIEASKASTGNLDVSLMPCVAATFVTQAAGEYEEKLKESELSLITSTPTEELGILADSRRMWRIFDNLMNNISKYAQKNTRVYLSLEKIDGKAVFTFKNTSREQLNISEEELMERFTRGDHSRNTEGNGLGLSIAKSMAELQNGDLKIEIDGDLFKAVLSFPLTI